MSKTGDVSGAGTWIFIGRDLGDRLFWAEGLRAISGHMCKAAEFAPEFASFYYVHVCVSGWG